MGTTCTTSIGPSSSSRHQSQWRPVKQNPQMAKVPLSNRFESLQQQPDQSIENIRDESTPLNFRCNSACCGVKRWKGKGRPLFSIPEIESQTLNEVDRNTP